MKDIDGGIIEVRDDIMVIICSDEINFGTQAEGAGAGGGRVIGVPFFEEDIFVGDGEESFEERV
jgi:hypothetical protein